MKNEVFTPTAKKSPNPRNVALYVDLNPLPRRSFDKGSNINVHNSKDQPIQARRMRRHSVVGVVEVSTLLGGWLEADDKSVKINPESIREGSKKLSSGLLRRSLDGGRLSCVDFIPPLRKKQDSLEGVPADKAKVLEDKISVQLLKVADMLTQSKDLANAFNSSQNPVNPSLHVYRKAWQEEKLALQKEKSDLEVTVYSLSQALDGSSAHAVALQGEVDSLRVDTERLMSEIQAIASTSERLRAQEGEAQAKVKTLEMEKDRHLSQIADLRSRITQLESECLKLKVALGSVDEENAAAKLVIGSMLESEEKIRGDIDSLRNLLIDQSAMLERERNKGEAKSRELLGLLSKEQSELNLAKEEMDGLSLSLKKEKADKQALLHEIANLKSNMEEELISARNLIIKMQEEESKQVCYLSALKDELAEVVMERSSLQAAMNASQDHVTEIASNSDRKLREANELIERMSCDLEKAREAETLANQRIASLSAELSCARKGTKERGLLVKAAKPTALLSTCSLVFVFMSGIFRR